MSDRDTLKAHGLFWHFHKDFAGGLSRYSLSARTLNQSGVCCAMRSSKQVGSCRYPPSHAAQRRGIQRLVMSTGKDWVEGHHLSSSCLFVVQQTCSTQELQ